MKEKVEVSFLVLDDETDRHYSQSIFKSSDETLLVKTFSSAEHSPGSKIDDIDLKIYWKLKS